MCGIELRFGWLVFLSLALLAGCQGTTRMRDAGPSTAEAEAAVVSAAAAEAVDAVPANQEDRPSQEGVATGPMGFVCWAAILESVSEIGKRCANNESPVFRAAIDKSISEIDNHLRQEGRWSEEQLESFKSQMGERTTSTDKLCGNNDALQMYRALERAGIAELEKTNASMLAKPGPPQWGSCL